MLRRGRIVAVVTSHRDGALEASETYLLRGNMYLKSEVMLEESHEQAPGAAGEIQHRLPEPLDLREEERQLRGIGEELAPALRHEAVVPHQRLGIHRWSLGGLRLRFGPPREPP